MIHGIEGRDGPVKSRYSKLEGHRQVYISRATRAAEVTIPALFPVNNASTGTTDSSADDLPTPFQGVGARGLNNLSSKLLLSVLPPNSPFFRYMADDASQAEIDANPKLKDQVDKALSKRERKVMQEIEKRKIRVTVFEAFKQLLLAGNVLLYLAPGGNLRMWRLDRYVIVRAPDGEPLEIIIKDSVDPRTMTQDVRSMIGAESNDFEGKGSPKTVDVYTQIKKTGAAWIVQQEANGFPLPGAGIFPLGKLPYMALRFAKIDGEHYGRGFVEEILGDLLSLEGLTKAIVEGAAAAARLLVLVKPNSGTRLKDIEKAPNGAVRTGSADDVTFMSMARDAKQNDFRIAAQTAQDIEKRLSLAFLLNTALQRKAERVTATEIREAATEIDDSLGGLFSILSVDFQLPLVGNLTRNMEQRGVITPLPEGAVEPAIITGLDALGRRSDLDRLIEFVGLLAQLGDQGLSRLQMSTFIVRIAAAIGIEDDGLVMTDADYKAMVAQQQQQQVMQEALKSLGPNAIKMLSEQMKQAA
jgi:hypothetical protein